MLLPQATAAELTRLGNSADPGTRAAVAEHPNTPPALLAQLGAEFPAEVLRNPALPLLRLAAPGLVAGWPTRTLERLTALPDAPGWLLRLAATHREIDVQLAAVTHHSLPDDVLRQLAASAFWTIREYVARKPQLPPELLRHLAQDSDYGVRLSVAGRTDLPEDVLEQLAQDPHPLVQAVILLRRDTSLTAPDTSITLE